jgi:HAE1 family hydrophobic/amphiphilic exporter-1
VIYAQLISLLVSVTVVTMLSMRAKPEQTEYRPMDWLKGLERRLLALGDPVKQNRLLRGIVVAAVATAVLGVFLMRFLDKEVLPKVDQGQFIVKIDLPIGSRLEVTDELATLIESALLKIPEVENTAVTIGSARGKREEVKVETLRPSQSLILVDLKRKRKRSSAAVVEELREQIKGYNLRGARVEVALQESEFQFAGAGFKPVLIEVKGFEFEKTLPLAELIKTRLEEIPGVVEIHDDMGEASPETKIEIDKKRAALYGISALDISLTAKAAIDGVVATTYRERGREFEIRVRLSEKDRERMESLGDLLLYSEVLETMIPLKEVADMKQGLGPSEIRRKDQQRTIMVSADILKGYKQAQVLEKVQEMLRGLSIPEDYQVVLSGQAREVRESFSKVYFALILSIVLIYMIMASQFESLIQPLLIMITVPLSIVGISTALFVTGTSLNVISLLGMVMLGGVVVNNGIVLMEYINQRRADGVPLVEAAFEASKVRTRPILMSALTSSIGLIPIALGLGEGSELRAPLAITTIGGLMSSTVLTLVVLPCFYILATRLFEGFMGIETEELAEKKGEGHGTP